MTSKLPAFLLLFEKRRIPVETVNLPPSLNEFSKNMERETSEKLTNGYLRQLFLKKIELSEEEIQSLKDSTVQQSKSLIWRDQHKGRLTASIFQRVDTMRKRIDADPSKLFVTILREKSTKQSIAIKHGISMEPQAKTSYVKEMKKKHRKFRA